MARSIFPFLLLFLVAFSSSRVQCHEEGYIAAEVSNKGLEFLKDLLIEKAESSLVPLELPKIDKYVKIPFCGRVQMALSNITIERVHVNSSTLKTGDSGIVIDVSGATANLSMNWEYSYSTWLLPITVSDKGSATVELDSLAIPFSNAVKFVNFASEHATTLIAQIFAPFDHFFCKLVDAFESKISSAVEDAVSKKINESIVGLDSMLQSLPKEVPVTNIAALNVTFVDDPELSESSLDLEVNGLFSAKDAVVLSSHYHRSIRDSLSCKEADKMVKISLHEDVLKSASSVYFNASKMQWIVDKLPDQSLLNTAGWRFIIPKLYKMYPNHDMNLNVSVSSPPTIEVEHQQIKATILLDVVIDVLDVEEVIPVLSFSMVSLVRLLCFYIIMLSVKCISYMHFAFGVYLAAISTSS
ncbi:UNVERIFIED_CONTAM: putative BPI/LBP family protein [Sesamum radiatum]|uniref:BPI/LBP family protein n=1 Tax=Sesamum radiatum TaxID=300843 RepID=A0AAW2KH64_SESRA